MINSDIRVPEKIIGDTISFLKERGSVANSEAVVLWLGRREASGITIEELYIPEQEASEDYFRIPPISMMALVAHVRSTGFFVAAQVHSHPKKAFHSVADDTWAVVRHVGALSLVLPYFASRTTVLNFVEQCAVFSLSATNAWCEVRGDRRFEKVRIA